MRNHSFRGINTKKIASFLALLSFTSYMPISCLPAFADIGANTLPDLNQAVNGNVDINGSQMDVSVVGGKGTVGQFDWNSFNVGKDATVNWIFNANNQTALNRVLASGGMSYIYGKLTETSGSGCSSCVNTSKVILINPSGILFGNGSQVDLNSFTASTYDIKGAKDLNSLTEAELKDYAGTGGTTGNIFNIAGYNKTVQFVANDNMVDGNGYITADATGTRLASIVADGADFKVDKSLAMVGNKIDIANSSLKTNYSSDNVNASNGTQQRSNIKLVTGDGVHFYYESAGSIRNNIAVDKATDKKATEDYGINIKDSQIRTGNFLAWNGVDKTNSSINIDGSKIYTKKLLGKTTASYDKTQTGTNGNIEINSANTVNIKNSDIQTTNDAKDGANISTGIGYGNMTITGGKDVTIDNSQLRTADSLKNNSASNITAGNINITSTKGDVNLIQDGPTSSTIYDESAVASAGNLTINAAGDVNVDGYDKIQAVGHGTANGSSSFTDRTITINGNNANFKDTYLTSKNLNVNAAKDINVLTTNVKADNTNLYGADTTIDDSTLTYNNLSFYNSDKKNNVTIKNQTRFNDKDDTTLKISTNGNLTLDNNELRDSKVERYNAYDLESTQGNIALKNDSFAWSQDGNVTLNAKNGGITVDKSYVYANGGNTTLNAKNNIAVNESTVWAKDGNMSVTSTAGKITSTLSEIAAEGGNTVLDQALTMDLDKDFVNSMVGATNKLSLISDADVVGTKISAGTGHINEYNDLLALNDKVSNSWFIYSDALVDAGNNVSITDLASAQNVDFVAGNNINLASTADMLLTDVSTKAGNNTTIAAAGKLETNGFEIKGGKKTTLEGKTVTTKENTVIAANGNKLAVNAEGAIDIDVTGVNNKNNGLEINADVNTSNGSDPLEGKTVKVDAKDGVLAVSKIKADTLDLTADEIIAAKTTISDKTDNVKEMVAAGADIDDKGYIEIRTEGGFNLDPTTDYNESNKDIYTGGNYGTTVSENTKPVGGQYDKETIGSSTSTVESELVNSTTTQGEEIGRTEISRTPIRTEQETVVGADGQEYIQTTTYYEVTYDVQYETNTTNTYEDTTVTKTEVTTTTYQDYETTITSNDKQHIATLNKEEQNGFVLVYGKKDTDTTTKTEVVGTDTKIETSYSEPVIRTEQIKGTETKQITVSDSHTELIPCEPEDEMVPDGADEVSKYVTIPRHQEGISNSAPVQNDLADTTSTVVAAAARLQIEEDDAANASDSGLTNSTKQHSQDDEDILE